jgi:hypothetical protein
MKYLLLGGAAALAASLSSHTTMLAQQPDQPSGPRYTATGQLIRPSDFREWMFVTSGLGMTYSEPSNPARRLNFTNVYVNPPSYRAFMNTGRWPDKTMFILEIRASSSEGSINKGGHFQSDLVVIEAAVKDEARFAHLPGKWAYFDFGREMKAEVEPLAATERCYACHAENAAVDNTFVQFYPTMLEVAKKHGTVKPGH